MTITSNPTDFSSMATSSLPNLGTAGGSSRYRSLHELRAAAMGSNAAAAAPPPDFTTRLPHLQDVPLKMQASHALQSTHPPSSTTNAGATLPQQQLPTFRTAQERTDYHLDRIVTNLLEQERHDTRMRLDAVLEEKQKARHDAFLQTILSEIKGDRTLGGSSRRVTAAASTSARAATVVESSASTSPTLIASIRPEDMEVLASYLNIVKHWNRDWQMPLRQVVQALSQVPAASSSSPEVWRLLDQILEHRSIGSLAYSCLQFQDVVHQRVRNAHRAGQDVTTDVSSYTNSLAQTVASYVKLTTVQSSSTNAMWAMVYYCLRCGDAVAAWNVLETSNTTGDDAVRAVVSQWSQAQGPAALVWDATQNLIALTDETARRTVADLHERALMTNGDTDAFYVATLGLMSLQDPIVDSAVIQTSEDYMFAWLWYVQSSEARRVELGDALRELGPSHFPESVWGYALPLIAAQQYTGALEHLAGAQARIPAVHVALVLHQAGMLEEDHIVTRLVLEHAAVLQSQDAPSAVEYLLRLPNEQRRVKEIGRLAVETNQLDRFPLEELGSDVAVSAIKMEASRQAKAKGDYDLAARLLFEAAHYNTLLSLLNEMLSSEMLKQSSSRKWRDQCKGFHAQFLTNAQSSPVLHTLQSKGQQDQLSTFRLLLEINETFELVESELFDKALTKTDELPLLPLTESECPGKVRQFHSLDANVKKVFPVFLENAILSLSSIYARLGMSGYNRGSSDAERNRLQKKAQLLLFSFGSALHSELPREVFDRMGQMERTMV